MAPQASTRDVRGILLAVLPWAGVLSSWLWVRTSALATGSRNLVTVVAVVVLATALVAAVDASALRFGHADGRAPRAHGPAGTFIFVALLWIIFYPIHIRDRNMPGIQSRLAILGAVAMVISVALIGYAIQDKLEYARRWD
jgi:hypothetical protein